MSSVAVNVYRRDVSDELHADLNRARWLANALDAQFSIAGVRFGFDAIAGLIPGIGDALTLGAAIYPVHLVKKHDLPQKYARKMIVNALIDFAIGSIPVLGDAFDVFYRANLRNLALLEKAVTERSGLNT